jgi:hypothetical protein
MSRIAPAAIPENVTLVYHQPAASGRLSLTAKTVVVSGGNFAEVIVHGSVRSLTLTNVEIGVVKFMAPGELEFLSVAYTINHNIFQTLFGETRDMFSRLAALETFGCVREDLSWFESLVYRSGRTRFPILANVKVGGHDFGHFHMFSAKSLSITLVNVLAPEVSVAAGHATDVVLNVPAFAADTKFGFALPEMTRLCVIFRDPSISIEAAGHFLHEVCQSARRLGALTIIGIPAERFDFGQIKLVHLEYLHCQKSTEEGPLLSSTVAPRLSSISFV